METTSFASFNNSYRTLPSILKGFIFILFFALSAAKAQDSSIDIGKSDSALHKKTLIIPFEPDMYMSDMDREIGRSNQMNQPQIVEKFRINFDRALENTVQLKNETQALLHDETSANSSQLVEVYSGITFVYTPIKRTQSKKDKAIAVVWPDKKTKQKDASLKNGEVYTRGDTIERYMKTVLTDSLLLKNLKVKTGAENYLFVNQFELKNYFEDVMQLQNDTYQREMRIHYSILNVEGKELVGGIAKCRFDNSVVNINKIIAASFPCAAKQIADALSACESSLISPKK